MRGMNHAHEWDPIGNGDLAPGFLSVEDVTVTFSGFKALNELKFAVEQGELRVVIGPNGAGKTTLLDVITGKTRPSSGRVMFRFNGVPTISPLREASDRPAGHRPQVPDAERLQEPDRAGKPAACPAVRRAAFWPSCWRRLAAADKDRVCEILDTIGLTRQGIPAGRHPGPRRKAVAGAGHAHGPGPRAAAGRRAGRRHDAARVGADRRTAHGDGPQAHALVIDHDMTFVRQIATQGHGAATRGRCCARARWRKCRAIPR